MDGNIGAALKQGDFQLLDEHALAAETRQRLVEPAVAFGRHRDKFVAQTRIRLHDSLGNHGRLCHGKGALTRRDP